MGIIQISVESRRGVKNALQLRRLIRCKVELPLINLIKVEVGARVNVWIAGVVREPRILIVGARPGIDAAGRGQQADYAPE
jgi:hypothetical protein